MNENFRILPFLLDNQKIIAVSFPNYLNMSLEIALMRNKIINKHLMNGLVLIPLM